MDQCTHEVRAEYWKGIIKACGQRPAGQSAKNWMNENGICEQSYYHWQRKFRQKAYEEMRKNMSLKSMLGQTGCIRMNFPVETILLPCLRGAQASAIIYSLTETARANDLRHCQLTATVSAASIYRERSI